MFKKTELFIAIIFSFFADSLKADVVFTNNGDKFVGTITEFDGQLLKIDTPTAGVLTIDAKWITSLTTDQVRTWEIKNAATDVRIEAATNDGYVMVDNRLITVSDLRLKRHKAPDKLSGNVELGLDMERDDDRKRELRLKADLHYQQNKWRHELNGEVKRGEQHGKANEDVLEINYTPDYLINANWLITVDTSYREEGVTTVSKYSHIGIGPGYRFWGEDKDQLDFMLSADKIWIKGGTIELELDAIAAGLDYRQFLLSERLESYIDYRITYPDWSGIDYIVNSTLGLRYSFTHYLYLSVKYDINKTRYSLGTLQERETNLVLGVKF
jgi:hypothetical protein